MIGSAESYFGAGVGVQVIFITYEKLSINISFVMFIMLTWKRLLYEYATVNRRKQDL